MQVLYLVLAVIMVGLGVLVLTSDALSNLTEVRTILFISFIGMMILFIVQWYASIRRDNSSEAQQRRYEEYLDDIYGKR